VPAGIAFDPASGTLRGVPAESGSTTLTFRVADRKGAVVSRDVQIQVAARLGLATAGLPRAKVGKVYRTQLAFRGGVGPTAWSIVRGHLPVGLKLDAKTGTIAGRARTAGSFRLSVVVSDSLGAKTSRVFQLSVVR
jgi:hypothetical protein